MLLWVLCKSPLQVLSEVSRVLHEAPILMLWEVPLGCFTKLTHEVASLESSIVECFWEMPRIHYKAPPGCIKKFLWDVLQSFSMGNL